MSPWLGSPMHSCPVEHRGCFFVFTASGAETLYDATSSVTPEPWEGTSNNKWSALVDLDGLGGKS